MRWWELGLDYLKALVWPSVVLAGLVMFRVQLRGIFDRVRSLKWQDLEARLDAITPAVEAKRDDLLAGKVRAELRGAGPGGRPAPSPAPESANAPPRAKQKDVVPRADRYLRRLPHSATPSIETNWLRLTVAVGDVAAAAGVGTSMATTPEWTVDRLVQEGVIDQVLGQLFREVQEAYKDYSDGGRDAVPMATRERLATSIEALIESFRAVYAAIATGSS